MAARAYVEANAFIGAYVPPETKRALIDVAYERRTSLSDVARSAFADYLEDRESKRPNDPVSDPLTLR